MIVNIIENLMIIVIIVDMDVKWIVKVLKGSGEDMTEKRFKLRFSKLGNGMITDTQKREHLYFDKKFLDVTLPKTYELLNELADENEELKQRNNELINKIDFLERIIEGDV